MAVGLYVRVSKVGGRTGEAYRSPKEQLEGGRATAQRLGLEIGPTVREEDVGGAVAVKDRRLEGLIVQCEEGALDGIIVEDVKRFGRSIVENAIAADRLRKCGARLIGWADGIDSADPHWKPLFDLQSMQAEHQREQIKERWARVNAGAVQRGIHVCAKPPVGYIREDRRLVVDPAAAPIVVRAFEMRADGASAAVVAEYVRENLGRPFSKQSALAMTRNDVYRGVARGAGGAENRDAHEPLVSAELFAAAKAKTGKVYVHDGSLASKARLTGLVFCAACENRMTVSGRASYMCFGTSAAKKCDAPAAITLARLDDYVAEQLDAHALAQWEVAVKAIKAEHGDVIDQDLHRAELERRLGGDADTEWLAANAAVAKAEANLSEWQADMDSIVEESSLAAYRDGLARLTQRLSAAQAEVWNLDDPGVGTDAPVAWLDGKPVPCAAYGDDIEADRRMFQRAVSRVLVHRAGPKRGHQPVAERVTIEWR